MADLRLRGRFLLAIAGGVVAVGGLATVPAVAARIDSPAIPTVDASIAAPAARALVEEVPAPAAAPTTPTTAPAPVTTTTVPAPATVPTSAAAPAPAPEPAPAAAPAPVAPVVVAETPTPAPPKEARVAGQDATVTIPSVGLRLPVVRGGQATIDRGVVAHYESPDWRPAVEPGEQGTYWLAAHNATHGSPFGPLPGVQVGDVVVVTPVDGRPVTYRITHKKLVGTTASDETVYGTDPTARRIMLQTCEGAAKRLLVFGERVY